MIPNPIIQLRKKIKKAKNMINDLKSSNLFINI